MAKTDLKRATADPADERESERPCASDDERLAMIAEAAYFRAERRGFQGGAAEATRDWLEAEAEIDAWLAQRDSEPTESTARPGGEVK
jgi:hypothetical protein